MRSGLAIGSEYSGTSLRNVGVANAPVEARPVTAIRPATRADVEAYVRSR